MRVFRNIRGCPSYSAADLSALTRIIPSTTQASRSASQKSLSNVSVRVIRVTARDPSMGEDGHYKGAVMLLKILAVIVIAFFLV